MHIPNYKMTIHINMTSKFLNFPFSSTCSRLLAEGSSLKHPMNILHLAVQLTVIA